MSKSPKFEFVVTSMSDPRHDLFENFGNNIKEALKRLEELKTLEVPSYVLIKRDGESYRVMDVTQLKELYAKYKIKSKKTLN